MTTISRNSILDACNAQLQHAASFVPDVIADELSDDGVDYAASAFELAARMIRITHSAIEPDTALVQLCNEIADDGFACDGVCDELAAIVKIYHPEY